MLQAESVNKAFGEVQAVLDLSLQIDRGEIVAMMGRSGSGKSTAMNLLSGLESPDSGHVFYDGQDIAELDEDRLALWRRANIGLVFQAFHLIPTLSALENVAFPLYPEKMSATERRDRAAAQLDVVGLGNRTDHRPSQLSGGEQQRVAIARALINDPGLIFADEPTGNLDTETGRQILELFSELRDRAGVALLMVTHDDEVAAMADRIIKMKDGVKVDD